MLSSGRNQMIYHRGTRGAFQAWADKVGDDAYLWDNYFPYFQKSGQFTPPSANAALRADNATASYESEAYPVDAGPLQISFPNYAMPASSYFGEAFTKGIGLNPTRGFSNGELNGHAYNPFTIDPTTGLRSSSETSFLSTALRNASAQRRSNIQIFTLTQAHRILFNGQKQATGALVNSAGKQYTVSARKEVILSAGAWHSPQLLMLSGIGPKATLQQHNIPVLSDRPGVGQNVWDTTNAGGVIHEVNVPTTAELNTPAGMAKNVDLFNQARTGFLASFGGDYIGWAKFSPEVVANMSQAAQDHIASFPADWPEIEHVIGSSAGNIEGSDATKNYVTVGISMIATKR